MRAGDCFRLNMIPRMKTKSNDQRPQVRSPGGSSFFQCTGVITAATCGSGTAPIGPSPIG